MYLTPVTTIIHTQTPGKVRAVWLKKAKLLILSYTASKRGVQGKGISLELEKSTEDQRETDDELLTAEA